MQNIPGYYPVIGMTDGIVEKIGWLPLGGYRIGIRVLPAATFIMRTLPLMSRNLTEGDTVAAGDILGFMGNTGYGKEGTVGKFPVHLHLGIYIQTPYHKELSVNPYRLPEDIFEKTSETYIIFS